MPQPRRRGRRVCRSANERGGLRRNRCENGRTIRKSRHPGRRLGQERRLQDPRHVSGALPRRDGRERHAKLADRALGGPPDAGAGRRRQDHPDVFGPWPAWPPSRLHRVLRLEVGRRRNHARARLRVGSDRHHGERDRSHRVPVAPDSMDVRRRRAGSDDPGGLSHASAEGSPRRSRRSRWAVAVPGFEGLGLLHRPHPLRDGGYTAG